MLYMSYSSGSRALTKWGGGGGGGFACIQEQLRIVYKSRANNTVKKYWAEYRKIVRTFSKFIAYINLS